MNRAFANPILIALVASLVALPAAAQQQRQQPNTYLFQISLLAAAKSGPNELADLPANTRQAIDDVRQFLPFKSYRLLDTALVRSDRVGRTTLTGPDDREFLATFSVSVPNSGGGKVTIRSFELVEKIELPASLIAGGGDVKPPVSPASKEVLSSSFAAEVGQTVVVGTSRLNGGDEALMVLFTSLP